MKTSHLPPPARATRPPVETGSLVVLAASYIPGRGSPSTLDDALRLRCGGVVVAKASLRGGAGATCRVSDGAAEAAVDEGALEAGLLGLQGRRADRFRVMSQQYQHLHGHGPPQAGLTCSISNLTSKLARRQDRFVKHRRMSPTIDSICPEILNPKP